MAYSSLLTDTLDPSFRNSISCLNIRVFSGCRKSGIYSEKKKREKRRETSKTGRAKDERGREKVGMVNEVECWQRIISMTSKGVVISRCLSPSCHGLRVVSHPRVIVLIQAVPFRPDFPFTPRSPFCSASSSHLVLSPRSPSRCRRHPS